MENLMQERVAQLENYIMKKCLWQFHSRSWDREKQNEGVLTKTMQILCDEPVDKSTPADRCYWADAVVLAEEYKSRFEWLSEMGREEIKLLMQALKDRIDYVTITGSLNKELTVKQY
ncbi:Fe-only nitrogenase subunit delta [Paenibacillus riograndensis]|uniref:Nitrogenase iron-iron protein delta chain n=1 Tax=Paenibacillus riograndensis SBR5 TaxID=1073571 RepID=A0A0E3WHD7_9BACL|nr:Fe-only nitrogenase subunit delta [Paenibacillus riograndensis]CQR55108.1 Fe-only nitrogenase FeFe protein subunit AnfG [Paenibacillus riograndensis SBR5]